MTILRFNTDQGRTTQAQLRQVIEAMTAELNNARVMVNNLVGTAWEAPAAYEFQDDVMIWQQCFAQGIGQLTELNSKLEAEIEEWEETARIFGVNAGDSRSGFAGGGAAGGGGGAISIGDLPKSPKKRELTGWQEQLLKRTDKWTQGILDKLLPQDLSKLDEYVTIKGETGATVPLEMFGLPFSGYIDAEDGLTIWRDENGAYRVAFNSVDAGGADFTGPQVGLRGEQRYEFAFNRDNPGDLSTMALLITTIGGSTILAASGYPLMEQATKIVSTAAMKDNLISVNNQIGVEGKYDAGVEVEGAVMVGNEVRRSDLNDNSWEIATSFKLAGEVKSEIPFLRAEVSEEITVNSVVDNQSGHTSSEVIVELQSSAGSHLSAKDLKDLLPANTEINLNNETQKIEVKYVLHDPADSVIDSIKQGNLDPIIKNNLEIEVKASSGITNTIGGELDLGIIGGKVEAKTTAGYEQVVLKMRGGNVPENI